ncbi:response regulator [Paraburkholderia sp. UCT31]|uniref:response regulator n=1 Tax=Paraburkholderia sp. UCT31 TaxID=2615209 RepID=UPI001655E091|nr:helix-turn-helix domain-containing protein [Paraburkholderia sp. UCT31]MBC8737203.1 response regulator [Paraburkholderia sp. UCT31]
MSESQSPLAQNEAEEMAQRLHALMEEKGIPPRSRASKLTQILGLSPSQSSRKLRGVSPLTVPQLRQVAEHFEVQAERLLQPPTDPDQGSVDATFIVGKQVIPGKLWVGERFPLLGRRPEFVALEKEGRWEVVDFASSAGFQPFIVDRFVMRFPLGQGDRVAIVDDDASFAEAIAEYLQEQGLDALAYSDVSEFYEELQADGDGPVFDAFIVDWNLGDYTGLEVMRRIQRSSSAAAPLILLTGVLSQGLGDANETVGQALDEKENAIYMQKPVDNVALGKTLKNMLRTHRGKH